MSYIFIYEEGFHIIIFVISHEIFKLICIYLKVLSLIIPLLLLSNFYYL